MLFHFFLPDYRFKNIILTAKIQLILDGQHRSKIINLTD